MKKRSKRQTTPPKSNDQRPALVVPPKTLLITDSLDPHDGVAIFENLARPPTFPAICLAVVTADVARRWRSSVDSSAYHSASRVRRR